MKRIVITGPKSSGKSNIGARFAELQKVPFYDLDDVLEQVFEEEMGNKLSFREIYRRHGEDKFRDLEYKAALRVAKLDGIILSTGGTSFTIEKLRDILTKDAYVVLLTNDGDTLWDRTSRKGIPSYLEGEANPKVAFLDRVENVINTVKPFAGITLDTGDLSIEDVAQVLDVEMMQRSVKVGK
jgi:shikimate kinase